MNWEQLKTIVWLRWRLSRHQWARHGGLGGVIAVFVGIGAGGLAGLAFIAALLGAIAFSTRAPSVMIWAVWLGLTLAFLFSWIIGLLTELGRSDTIDLQRLMHLPVALGQAFVINYLASHLSLSIVFFVPAMLGLAVGLALARGAAMLLLVPLVIAMVGMVTAWTYHLRGWLAAMMVNPRRRRSVIALITLALVLIAQGPNLYFNVVRPDDRYQAFRAQKAEDRQRGRTARDPGRDLEKFHDKFLLAQAVIPPLWLPAAAEALAEGRTGLAVVGALGCLGVGALGLQRAYRTTVRAYRSDGTVRVPTRKQPAPQSVSAQPSSPRTQFLELRVPAVSEHAGAIFLASFRSMVRSPEVKMLWGSSFLAPILVSAFLLRAHDKLPAGIKPFVAIGLLVFAMLTLVQFLGNQFGLDRDGFRALVLFPVDRRDIVLGKNLSCLPVVAGTNLFLLLLVCAYMRLPVVVAIAAVLQLATMVLLALIVGTLLSILLPYRTSIGSLKPTKVPGPTMFVLVICQLFFPSVMAPVFAAPLAELIWRDAGLPSTVPVNLLISAALAGCTALLYWKLLGPLGRLLQRRETKILSAITSEQE